MFMIMIMVLNYTRNNLYFEEIADLISKHITLLVKLIMLRDFNIHWSILTDSNTLKRYYIIDSFQLKRDNIFYLMIIRDDEDPVLPVIDV